MANGKKGQLYQFMVPMVDATDFASIESGITESDFNSGATKKFYGCNHGGSAATTSGTISKTASLVRSGVFRITLKTSENNYDQMMVRISKTGAAEQIVVWENVDNDDSDIMSALTVIQSMASDAASAAVQANSRVLLNQSRVSDVQSYLVALSGAVSDVYSAVVNDVYSHLIGVAASDLSDIYSLLSDLNSNLQSRIPKEVASKSLLSDVHSDLASKIAGITASVSASDISDIASAVKVILASDLSDILSAAVQTNSRVLLNQSRVSDIYSLLSDTNSDLASKIGGITASVSASDISDIASAVRAILISDLSDIHSAATAGASRALINQSRVSDVYSLLSDLDSNFQSRVPKETAARSQLSDLASDLRSYVVGISGTVSDIYSLLSDVGSDLTVLASNVSDIESAIDAGVPIGASDMSDIRSAVTAAGLGAAGADPTGVPGVTATYGAKLDFLTALARNKVTQDDSLTKLFNDGGSQIASAPVSYSASTSLFTRDEWAG